MSTAARVKMWGRTIGAVAMVEDRDYAAFQYDPDFLQSAIEVSPLHMPLEPRIYTFAELDRQAFAGLPGLLADSLPDRFGHALIDAWLATQGRAPASFDAVERLCYVGSRGMGAMEFEPATGPAAQPGETLELRALVELANDVLQRRQDLTVSFADPKRSDALKDILRVGTSAGGARAKAVIAWNPETNEVRSGQVDIDAGFEHWMIKFDGVSDQREDYLGGPLGYGALEYAYALMAKACGINMSHCRLLEEEAAGRRHFMTQRFDRGPAGKRLHMQTLGALAHLDFNQAGAHSYEQLMLLIRQLDLGMDSLEEQFRRMAFNIIARNQDDHVKNVAFLMTKGGQWSLSPAYDLTFSYNPEGRWTSQHQMSLNGKRSNFELEDFQACGRTASLKRGRAEEIVQQVQQTIVRWPEFADQAGVSSARQKLVQENLRLNYWATSR